jgi:hypothetical protein
MEPYTPIPRPPPEAFVKMHVENEIVVEFMDGTFDKSGKKLTSNTFVILKPIDPGFDLIKEHFALRPGSAEGVWDWDFLYQTKQPSNWSFLDDHKNKA